MLRHRRFLLTMHRLALMGALLMALAPVVSRWVQSQAPAASQAIQAMCHGVAAPVATMPEHAGMEHAGMTHAGMQHAGHAMNMDMPMQMAMPLAMEYGAGMPMPPGHDEAACDYCVLAANLLPFVLVLLVLALLAPAIHTFLPSLARPRIGGAWPAHAARGPPLLA
ncbi:hypothetical protein SAMN05428989_0329 [Pseudoxanthomonas sp. GM95]|uniref:DUF2946 family protein n=1 Tax=Pseudoxanthomonas sp. GM95 TaxID=1881043 RepID=UPI0008AD2F62|nr:DUF2946 family protein [Pseudoxanthomonas sp. GM95]SEK55071.1 hypothetical protein SAMN05428989_0329 [Pseudoxanthomonas sp. GM95]